MFEYDVVDTIDKKIFSHIEVGQFFWYSGELYLKISEQDTTINVFNCDIDELSTIYKDTTVYLAKVKVEVEHP